MASSLTRRRVLASAGAAGALSVLAHSPLACALDPARPVPLEEFGYHQVKVTGAAQSAQAANVTAVLTSLDPDSLLKPFRAMSGRPAPGTSLGGWYQWLPDYDFHHGDAGLAPGATFGQWTSALARLAAAKGSEGRPDEALAARVKQLHAQLAQAIGPGYFAQTRFAGYSLDKLVCGLVDAHLLLGDAASLRTLDQVTDAAVPSLPQHAVDRDVQWKPGADISWMWDETYTLPENLFRATAAGAGPRYRQLATRFLDDTSFFAPLARGENILGDHHAYSYVNALCSAMAAYLIGGSAMHLAAARNGFDFLERQSFATGGWGPDETLRKPGFDQLAKSLTASHNSFETPCGGYAHMKLARGLLRATGDGRYGDSMERVLHNGLLGCLPLQADGRSFYSSDYNDMGTKVYSIHRWPCCSGTLPQAVADYGINTYLRGPQSVWVNLYQPSELRWREGSSTLTLTQTGPYRQDGRVAFSLTASSPARFALKLRMPAWTGPGASLRVNGRTVAITSERGFVAIDRLWRTGDRVELDLAFALRLEPLAADDRAADPERAALLWGPLVLFARRTPGETGPLTLKRTALLDARRGPTGWAVQDGSSVRTFVPFTDLGELPYSTYVTAT